MPIKETGKVGARRRCPRKQEVVRMAIAHGVLVVIIDSGPVSGIGFSKNESNEKTD